MKLAIASIIAALLLELCHIEARSFLSPGQALLTHNLSDAIPRQFSGLSSEWNLHGDFTLSPRGTCTNSSGCASGDSCCGNTTCYDPEFYFCCPDGGTCPETFDCSSNNTCCISGFAYCGDNSCYDPSVAICCTNSTSAWSCGKGSNCCSTGSCVYPDDEICCPNVGVCFVGETCCATECCNNTSTCGSDGVCSLTPSSSSTTSSSTTSNTGQATHSSEAISRHQLALPALGLVAVAFLVNGITGAILQLGLISHV